MGEPTDKSVKCMFPDFNRILTLSDEAACDQPWYEMKYMKDYIGKPLADCIQEAKDKGYKPSPTSGATHDYDTKGEAGKHGALQVDMLGYYSVQLLSTYETCKGAEHCGEQDIPAEILQEMTDLKDTVYDGTPQWLGEPQSFGSEDAPKPKGRCVGRVGKPGDKKFVHMADGDTGYKETKGQAPPSADELPCKFASTYTAAVQNKCKACGTPCGGEDEEPAMGAGSAAAGQGAAEELFRGDKCAA